MKKYLLSFAALVLVVVMTVSCNNQGPKDVATTWLNGFYHMDYESAKKVSTEDTKNLLSQLQALTSMVKDSTKKEMKKINIVVKSVKVNGDTAKVMYGLSDQPGKDMPLDLIKKDGKWLVQFTKSNKNASQNDGEETPPAGEVDTTDAATAPPDHTTAEDTTKN